jgi:hypothetical protein
MSSNSKELVKEAAAEPDKAMINTQSYSVAKPKDD